MTSGLTGFAIPGGWEWLIILVVALLIFGRRLPEIARGVGKSLTEFKKGINEAKEGVEDHVDEIKSDIDKSSQADEKAGEQKQDEDIEQNKHNEQTQ